MLYQSSNQEEYGYFFYIDTRRNCLDVVYLGRPLDRIENFLLAHLQPINNYKEFLIDISSIS